MAQPPATSTKNSLGAVIEGIAGTIDTFGQSYIANKCTSIRRVADVGTHVREARKAMKLSQQSFADLAGVGRRFVSELESGKGSVEFERVLKVCQAAGVDIFAMPRTSQTRQVQP